MPYLWIWLLIAPPLLALIDFMTSSANTQFGHRDHTPDRTDFRRDSAADRPVPVA